MRSSWDYFDKIYCISLIERADRQKEAIAQFERVGLTHKVEFVIVPKHPTDCEQGIFESHMLCMSKGLSEGAEHILIFEDDVLFERFSPALLDRCIAFMASDPRWHMLFLGCMVKGSRQTAHPGVIQIRYRSLTQAYVVHRRYAEHLLAHPWQGVPYDDFLKALADDHMYAVYPSFAFQSSSRSDNERYLRLDRFRRLCGGLHRLQLMNEFYHRNRWLVLGAHALVLLLILMVIL